MTIKIDFNCDMGESFGSYKMGLDEEVIKHITSANIACGFHAGDPMWMRKTVNLAQEHNVAVGAHPSFPDLKGFGRRNINATADEVKNDVVYQAGALAAFTENHKLQHIKPHGAMYNQAVNDSKLGRAICEASLELDPDIILLALSGSEWVALAERMGVRIAREVFADRAIHSDGTLVDRAIPGSVLHDTEEVVDRSLRMVTEGKIVSIEGEVVDVQADSICLHGDTPGSVQMAERLNQQLQANFVEIVPLNEIV